MSRLNKLLEIKASTLTLPKGSTTNDVPCPWCKQAKSFSISRTTLGDLLFLCHRASCNESGYIRCRAGGTSDSTTVKREFNPRMFDHPTFHLDGTWLSQLLDAYHLSEAEIHWAGWLCSPNPHALVMPVYSPHGARRGIVTKHFDPSVIPKSITYKEMDDNWMGWYIRKDRHHKDSEGKYGSIVVVEDGISALKASRRYPTVAIYGTHINFDMLEELTDNGHRIVLCLDKDATQKSYDYVRYFAPYGNFCAIPLSKDIKDMTEEEFIEWETLIVPS